MDSTEKPNVSPACELSHLDRVINDNEDAVDEDDIDANRNLISEKQVIYVKVTTGLI